ncbi:MAG: hydrolase 1, exosortase A system-associated [Burkholderiales bacterium]|nr:hydrolase 1, exosortase A system-associated [Burkholderiales bacterium]
MNAAPPALNALSAPTTPPALDTPREEAFAFGCEGERLLGILHRPAAGADAAAAATGVVVIVGGPQYRAGSHRQFVHLARALAAAGHPVLRFDMRGMGDSGGAQRSFEQISADIAAALDALFARAPGVQRAVLWGLCDGASAALLYLHERADARVQGLCLLNPWVRSEASLARTHVKHYYARRLRERDFWLKLLKGGVGLRAARGLLGNLRRARAEGSEGGGTKSGAESTLRYQDRMARGWQRFAGPTLLVLSGDDYTAREFEEQAKACTDWRALIESSRVQTLALSNADHTFSATSDKRALEARLTRWLQEAF